MEEFRIIAEIIYYLGISLAAFVAVIVYLRAKKLERFEKECRIYDELDNRFFEYQKLALDYYDLDILDIPNNDPSLAFDSKRKREIVAYSILFSLFERAYLMFGDRADTFRQRQWSGWRHFLNDFLRRDAVQTAWGLSKQTYDTEFQKFIDRKIAAFLAKPSAELARALSLNLPHLEIAEPEAGRARSVHLGNGAPESPTAEVPVLPAVPPDESFEEAARHVRAKRVP